VARALLWEGRFEEAASVAAGTGEPWSSFVVAAARIRGNRGTTRTLLALAEDPDAESRVRLWAWTALRGLGVQPSGPMAQDVVGVVIEVPVDDGTDVLAAYSDGSVRFLGAAGRYVAREADEPDANSALLLDEARVLVTVAPQPRRLEPVEEGMVRLTALTAFGVHSVEVPWSDLEENGRLERLLPPALRLLDEVTQV
jgi:hypothetical protein